MKRRKRRCLKFLDDIITKEYLVKNHIEDGISLREIGRMNDCEITTISKYVKKYGLKANPKRKDLTGKVFGRWTVISFSHTDRHGGSVWNVECECGKKKKVSATTLKSGGSTSCGCYNKEVIWMGCGDLSMSYFGRIKAGALKRKLEFSIDIEYIWNLFQNQGGKCALSGVDLVMDRGYAQNLSKVWEKRVQTASLDRIDSSKGYVYGNVQWVHSKINLMKLNFSEPHFFEWCRNITEFQKSKPEKG